MFLFFLREYPFISCNKKFLDRYNIHPKSRRIVFPSSRKNNNNNNIEIETSLGEMGSIVWKIHPCIIYSIMQRATFISRHRSVSLAGRCCGLPRRGGNRRAENGFADSNLMRFHSQLTGPYTRLTWINGANDYPATPRAIPGRIYLNSSPQTGPHIAPNEFLSLPRLVSRRNWVEIRRSFFGENYFKGS